VRVWPQPEDRDIMELVPDGIHDGLLALGFRFVGTVRQQDTSVPPELAPHAVIREPMRALREGSWREAVYAQDLAVVAVESFCDGPCLTLASVLVDGALVRTTAAPATVLTALGGTTRSWKAAAEYRAVPPDPNPAAAWAAPQARRAKVWQERGAEPDALDGLLDAVRIQRRVQELALVRPLADVWPDSIPEHIPLRPVWQWLLRGVFRLIDATSHVDGPPQPRTVDWMRNRWTPPDSVAWEY
jgi:hypothetical protein